MRIRYFEKTTVLVPLLCLAIVTGPVEAEESHGGLKVAKVRVMTQNLYLGADLDSLAEANSLLEVPALVAQALENIRQTKFPERAEALADEIQGTLPDLIALQEVSLFRRQSPGDFLFGNPKKAEEVLFDYLEILLEALEARFLDYEVASLVENADFELPSLPEDGLGLLDDLRLTDRDVILARHGTVITSNPTSRHYTAMRQIELGSLTVEFPRGFTAVDAKIRGFRGTTYRVVNTHLENVGAGDGVIQALQATELIGELAEENLPVILLGDFNSSPQDAAGSLIPPYAQFTFAGYLDTWLVTENPGPGFTCCQDKTLTNEESEHDERIDHVFFRPGPRADLDFFVRSALQPVQNFVVGDQPQDKTSPSGLWPSDHAGMVAMIKSLVRGVTPRENPLFSGLPF